MEREVSPPYTLPPDPADDPSTLSTIGQAPVLNHRGPSKRDTEVLGAGPGHSLPCSGRCPWRHLGSLSSLLTALLAILMKHCETSLGPPVRPRQPVTRPPGTAAGPGEPRSLWRQLAASGTLGSAGFLSVFLSVCLMGCGLFTSLHSPGDSQGCPENAGQSPSTSPQTWTFLTPGGHSPPPRAPQVSPILGSLQRLQIRLT